MSSVDFFVVVAHSSAMQQFFGDKFPREYCNDLIMGGSWKFQGSVEVQVMVLF